MKPSFIFCLGQAGAELANVANEGALECGRRGGNRITSLDVYNGLDRILQVFPVPLIIFKLQSKGSVYNHSGDTSLQVERIACLLATIFVSLQHKAYGNLIYG